MATALLEEQALPEDSSDPPESGAVSADLQSVSDPADGLIDMDRVHETLRACCRDTTSTCYWTRRIRTSKTGTDSPRRVLWCRCGETMQAVEEVGVPDLVFV